MNRRLTRVVFPRTVGRLDDAAGGPMRGERCRHSTLNRVRARFAASTPRCSNCGSIRIRNGFFDETNLRQ
jgi:hypothetical protein